MKSLRLSLVTLGLLTLMSCKQSAEQKTVEGKHRTEGIATDRKQRIERVVAAQDSFNKERGQTSNSGWFCPDNTSMFPPVDIKSWNKVPVVSGRLPTFEETQNGTSLIYYDINTTPDAKAYDTTLPKLASFFCPATKKKKLLLSFK